MEKIATSFCSFESLVRKYTYVDKTDMLWRLVSDSTDRMFFISRPRRFGKSLMLDTLKCIFEGRRDLFNALADVAKRHFHLFMGMLGAKVEPERPALLGDADAIIETKTFGGVFEFKFNRSASAAIRQIREKGYADPYKGDSRPVTLVGINFRTAKRNIDEPLFSAYRR